MIDHFILYGEPRGKERPRVANGHAYTPPKTREYEEALRLAWLQERHGFYTGNVKMRVIAYYKIPKSASKAEKCRMANGEISPTRKPDCDNVLKIVSDALQGLAYPDDKQIHAMMIEKKYSYVPRVEVWLTDEGLNKIE